MGSSNSKPQYTDNSAQVNANINNIRTQITELNKDLNIFKNSIDLHIKSVENNFLQVEYHFYTINTQVLQIQNDFKHSFQLVDSSIKSIESNILTISKHQLQIETLNKQEHLEIYQNDWKENFERTCYQEFQKLKNLKNQLEIDLLRKISMYLIFKDKYNEYRFNYIQTQTNIRLINLQKQNNLISKLLAEKLNIQELLPYSEELLPYDKELSSNTNNNLEWQTIIPELDNGVEELFLMTDGFEEIMILEKNLQIQVFEMIQNFSNKDLLNPLDDDIVTSEDFAKKLFDSGVNSIEQINISEQNEILIKNGFNYVPEYKYEYLKNKFIMGCENLGLKLNWKNENIKWIVKYLYSKITNKSISEMITYANSKNSIYPIEYESLEELGIIGYNLYLNRDTTEKMDLRYEIYPQILYNIFKTTEIKDITIELIEEYGYKSCSFFALENIKQIIFRITNNNPENINDFKTSEYKELVKINQNIIIRYIIVKYMEDKKTMDIKFFTKTETLIKFINDITQKLLDEYNKIINNSYEEYYYIKIDYSKFKILVSNQELKYKMLLMSILKNFDAYYWNYI
jgi:hypothetical protein